MHAYIKIKTFFFTFNESVLIFFFFLLHESNGRSSLIWPETSMYCC